VSGSGNSLLEIARAYVKAGLSVIPIDHRTKRPYGPSLPKGEDGKPTWKQFQERLPEDRELKAWFGSGKVKAMAIVCGAISGGLLVIDFDVPGYFEEWKEMAGNLVDGLPVQRTGGGGYQVFVRCPEPGRNAQLAWHPNEKEVSGREIAIETRGDGGYVLVPPSLHPSGGVYAWRAGGPDSIPMVSQAQADALLAAARKLDRAPYTKMELEAQERQAAAAKTTPPDRWEKRSLNYRGIQ
jgi:hypothetical protein